MVSDLWEGAFLTLLGVITAFIGHWVLNWWDIRKRIHATKQGIYEELKELRRLYNEELGVHWENFEEGKDAYEISVSLTQNYFTMYESNANLIGRITNSDLRLKIVKVYTLLKVITDSYKIHSTFLDKRNKAYDEGRYDLSAKIHSELVGSAVRLKGYHYRFMQLTEDIFEILREELSECR